MLLKKTIPYGTLLIFLFWTATVLLAIGFWSTAQKDVPPELLGVLRPEPKPLQPFTLVDQYNQPFTQEDLKGKWSMLFFGYTYCPDICPMALSTLTSVVNELKWHPDVLSDTKIVFVSVDPQRDKPEVLAGYMEFFGKEFLGVTGTEDGIDDLTHQFGAGYIKEPESAPGEYQIAHTSSIFLVDPKMRLVAAFSQPHQPGTIVEQYQEIRAFY